MKRSADATFDIAESSSSSITLPSPQAQSPASSSCSDSQPAGPSRKRARGDITPEERKEARAHRNRIAAQNSRDRRKAQFVFLERRVAELEEENRQLKAGMGLTELRNTTSDNITNEQREREKAKEKENEELRERIKTLENGWDAVVKALAASGLPLQIPSPSAPNSLQSESSSTPSHPSISFPAMVQPSPVFPLTPASSTPTSSPNSEVELDDFETTCHLAAGGLATNQLQLEFISSSSSHPLPSSATSPAAHHLQGEAATSSADEALMEDLFREILAPSPSVTPSALPAPTATGKVTSPSIFSASTMASASPPVTTTMTGSMETWDGDAEMQKLLDMLPLVQPDSNGDNVGGELNTSSVDFPSSLDLEMCGWDMGQYIQQPPSSIPTVGAF